jgi:hypothetical protein
MKHQIWYKIVDEVKPGVFKTLFHGVNGSRVLNFGEWLTAEIKDVKDGSSKHTYKSGWHIVPTYEECLIYLQKFRNVDKKRIVRCHAKNIWPKSHIRHNIHLAEYINIEGVC